MKLFQIVSNGKKLDVLLTETLNQMRYLLRARPEDIVPEASIFLREKKIVRHHIAVKKGAVVSILVPEKFLIKPCFELTTDHIAYEDSDIIIIDKPSGLPTQSTQKPGEDHLYSATIAFLTKKNPAKLAYVGLHHRLDRDTSGLVLMTKKSSANKSISDQFRDKKMIKKYRAIVEGEVPKQKRWKVEAPLRRLFESKLFRFGIDHKKGDAATTLFEYQHVLVNNHHLIECQPITGRTHQIRIHLASSQLPIIGDRLYGVTSEVRMQLHAYRLQFDHPMTGKAMDIVSQRQLELEQLPI